jgi:hypothetical protein
VQDKNSSAHYHSIPAYNKPSEPSENVYPRVVLKSYLFEKLVGVVDIAKLD